MTISREKQAYDRNRDFQETDSLHQDPAGERSGAAAAPSRSIIPTSVFSPPPAAVGDPAAAPGVGRGDPISASSGDKAPAVHPAPLGQPPDERPPSRAGGGGDQTAAATVAHDDGYELLLAFGDRDVVLEVYCAGQRVARDRAATIRAANDRARDLIEEDRAWRSGSSSP